MSETHVVLARAYIAAREARKGAQSQFSDHEAVMAADVAPILRRPIKAMLGSPLGDDLHEWAQRMSRESNIAR